MQTRLAILFLLALATLTTTARADVPPSRKSGLWETTVTMDRGMPTQTIKECVDATTDAEMMKMATDSSKAMGGACSKHSLTRTSAGFESESVCSMGGSTVSSKGTFTGDFAAEYKGEVVTTYNPPMFGNGGSKTTFTAKYLGACSTDMKPGDIITSNGMKTNMKDSIAQAEKLAGMMKNAGAGQNGAAFGGDIGQAMAAAQGQMKPEDIKAMQEAMKQLQNMNK